MEVVVAQVLHHGHALIGAAIGDEQVAAGVLGLGHHVGHAVERQAHLDVVVAALAGFEHALFTHVVATGDTEVGNQHVVGLRQFLARAEHASDIGGRGVGARTHLGQHAGHHAAVGVAGDVDAGGIDIVVLAHAGDDLIEVIQVALQSVTRGAPGDAAGEGVVGAAAALTEDHQEVAGLGHAPPLGLLREQFGGDGVAGAGDDQRQRLAAIVISGRVGVPEAVFALDLDVVAHQADVIGVEADAHRAVGLGGKAADVGEEVRPGVLLEVGVKVLGGAFDLAEPDAAERLVVDALGEGELVLLVDVGIGVLHAHVGDVVDAHPVIDAGLIRLAVADDPHGHRHVLIVGAVQLQGEVAVDGEGIAQLLADLGVVLRGDRGAAHEQAAGEHGGVVQGDVLRHRRAVAVAADVEGGFGGVDDLARADNRGGGEVEVDLVLGVFKIPLAVERLVEGQAEAVFLGQRRPAALVGEFFRRLSRRAEDEQHLAAGLVVLGRIDGDLALYAVHVNVARPQAVAGGSVKVFRGIHRQIRRICLGDDLFRSRGRSQQHERRQQEGQEFLHAISPFSSGNGPGVSGDRCAAPRERASPKPNFRAAAKHDFFHDMHSIAVNYLAVKR